LQDNRGVLVALAGLLLLGAFCLRRWQRVGRDPLPGVIITRYDPPAGYSPAGLRFVQRMGYDTRCFSADLLSLAVAGKLRIHREKGLLKEDWELEKTGASGPGPAPEADILLSKLFESGTSTLELKNTNAVTVSGAQLAHLSALDKRLRPAMFKRNAGSIGIAFLILAATGVLSLLLGGGNGLLLILPLLLAMLVMTIVFAVLVKAYTQEGRRLLDEIEGLKRYLSVAERDELGGHLFISPPLRYTNLRDTRNSCSQLGSKSHRAEPDL
jgi:hypothetical protein